MKYFEAFSEGGFHSAFMTTYAFGTLAFEDIPFPKLRGAGCRNIVVLADHAMVNQAFSDYGPPRYAGSSYHLVKARAPSAFHPKMTLMIGETKGRLIVGSANLTALGLGGNKEQVASVAYSEDHPQHAVLFKSALGYLRRYVPEDDPWFEVSLQRAIRSTPWLAESGLGEPFLGDGTAELNLLFDRPEINLLSQITASIGGDPVERLVVISPYWDAKLEGLSRLRAALGNPATDILIENDLDGFPTTELSKFSDVSLFDVSPHAEGRFLHAKLIIAQGHAWDHVVSGSMNCTFPALMGPSMNGNAEAGIYRRVSKGSALEALGLADYQTHRMDSQELARLQQSFSEPEPPRPTIDGGSLILQAGTLSWIAPLNSSAPPSSMRLFDRDGRLSKQIELKVAHTAYSLEPDETRPKYGLVDFGNGLISSPVQVTDLDYLAVTTLPPQRGRKRRLMDKISESNNEDLDWIETLNQLEALEEAEKTGKPISIPKSKPDGTNAGTREYEPLSYDEFIRARTQANAQGKSFGLYMNKRNDSPSSVLSTCLNRMIGLVGPDLRGEEEDDLDEVGDIDFRTTEPQSLDDDTPKGPSKTGQDKKRAPSAQAKATAKRFQEAVIAFEKRSKSFAGKEITTAEMVRLRALLQIMLNHAKPVEGATSSSQILPLYTVEGYDWPRLIGRLLLQHFGATRALQNLTVMPDESEQRRVLEYLAVSNWAAHAAYSAAKSEKKASGLWGPLERLGKAIETQTKTILSVFENDRLYYSEIYAKLDKRFGVRLGIPTGGTQLLKPVL